jgi:hypothetical protein
MVPAVHENYHMDSEDLVGPIFHPLVATSFVFRHNRCCRGGGQAHSMIETTSCTHCSRQSSLIRTCQQISPSLLWTNLCMYEGGVLVPPNLHKPTLIAPPSMRDDFHS